MSKVSHLHNKIISDTNKTLFRVKWINYYVRKKIYPEVHGVITNVKTGLDISITMPYSDFVMKYSQPDPYIMDVLYGKSNKDST